ncbi:uric acid permease [Bacillus subtilis]|nr:uric acid permease [Bacillus subtilis]
MKEQHNALQLMMLGLQHMLAMYAEPFSFR